VPGRGEIGADQEINYPPVMRALSGIGYAGYVGLEFIPTRNAMSSLREALAVLDMAAPPVNKLATTV
jgi:hydroxypyruvate isomerase